MTKEEKIGEVEHLVSLIKSHPVIGIINMHKTPAKAFQRIKRALDEKAELKVIKKLRILFALDKLNRKELKDKIGVQPALILTDMDPFRLYNYIRIHKSPASAKPGDIPKNDIEIKAGPTELMPGPAISTLQKVKIPAKVEGGKIAIIKDKVVCKAGEEISEDIAAALNLLKMEPMEIGLNIETVWQDGTIYTKDQLYFDLEGFLENISLASGCAISLSINTGYPTKETISLLLFIVQ